MTVKELVEELKEYPDDYDITIIIFNIYNGESEAEYLSINEIYETDNEIMVEAW